MNLLLDFITVAMKGGASEYARYFIMELARMKREGEMSHINLYALFDSSKGIAYEDLREERLSNTCQIEYIDIVGTSICEVVEKWKIDRFFITCAQFLGYYEGIENLKCEVICVIHDLCDQEFYFNHIYEYVDLIRDHTQVVLDDNSLKTKAHNLRIALGIARRIVRSRKNYEYEKGLERMKPIVRLLQTNSQSKTIVVSEYTKASLVYNFAFNEESIIVLYSPERLYYDKGIDCVEDKTLREVIESKKKYYLMVSSNRAFKNPNKVVRVFRQYVKFDSDAYLVTIGYQGRLGKNIINVDFLSDNDLASAYKNCYALVYPSFFEGFGYPPIEAMRYGKPVLCTNATSVPEILGDAPIYFSPFYESGIFKALKSLTGNNYASYCELSKQQYQRINNRQLDDAKRLIEILTTKKNI